MSSFPEDLEGTQLRRYSKLNAPPAYEKGSCACNGCDFFDRTLITAATSTTDIYNTELTGPHAF